MNVQSLVFKGCNVRLVTVNDANWWSLKDVCEVLGISDHIQAAERLDDDERGWYQIPTPGGSQEAICINESGLYSLILRSDKPEAKDFKKWVTSEVLPSIRKYGFYFDKDYKMNTKDIAYYTSTPHATVLRKMSFVLPKYRKKYLNRELNKGIELNPIESFILISRLVKTGIDYYLTWLPEKIQAVINSFIQ